jgi:hypothetical protein
LTVTEERGEHNVDEITSLVADVVVGPAFTMAILVNVVDGRTGTQTVTLTE